MSSKVVEQADPDVAHRLKEEKEEQEQADSMKDFKGHFVSFFFFSLIFY